MKAREVEARAAGEEADAAPAAQTTFWPQQTHGNGMFVAIWRKKAVVPA